jgi:hypothetical protein
MHYKGGPTSRHEYRKPFNEHNEPGKIQACQEYRILWPIKLIIITHCNNLKGTEPAVSAVGLTLTYYISEPVLCMNGPCFLTLSLHEHEERFFLGAHGFRFSQWSRRVVYSAVDLVGEEHHGWACRVELAVLERWRAAVQALLSHVILAI